MIWDAGGFHAAGHVDRIASKVISEFAVADHPRDHGPTVCANPHFKVSTVLPIEYLQLL